MRRKSTDARRRETATPICASAIRTRHLEENKLGVLAEPGLSRRLSFCLLTGALGFHF